MPRILYNLSIFDDVPLKSTAATKAPYKNLKPLKQV